MNWADKKMRPLLGCIPILFFNCISSDFNSDDIIACSEMSKTNLTMAELHDMAGDDPREILDSLSIGAYVISNDKSGNMFNELILQDKPKEPEFGIHLAIELRDTYLRYPPGMAMRLNLKGLWLQKKQGRLILGKPFLIVGNTSIGRIPFHEIDHYLIPGCSVDEVYPKPLNITEIAGSNVNTLVQFEGIEFLDEEIGHPLAEEREETVRSLTDCEGNILRLITSGYSDFFDEKIPDAHGSISGILSKDSKGYYLRLRELGDMNFNSTRCRIPVEPMTTDAIFISEIADPDNAPEGRFIELYNNLPEEFDLKGWHLVRYTNANTEPGLSTDLTGHKIGPYKTLVLAADSTGFHSIFGFPADIVAGKNSAADSNGDDNMVLVDPFGTTIDIFGRIGEDGSATDHEFEDGRAIRNPDIIKGNPEFFPSEWTLFNDSGLQGTIENPQQAPDDFTPGVKD